MEDFMPTLKGYAAVLKSKLFILDEVDAKLLSMFEEHTLDKEIDDANLYQINIDICLAK